MTLTPTQQRLAAESLPLAGWFAKRAARCNQHLDPSEIYGESVLMLCRSAATWDENREASFCTYSVKMMWYGLQNLRYRHRKTALLTDAIVDSTAAPGKSVPDLVAEPYWFDTARRVLTETQYSVVWGWAHGRSFRQIAQDTGITYQAVQQAFRAGIRKLQRRFANLDAQR